MPSDDGSKRAAKTTIVGGQPPGNERMMAEVPVGIEELLAMAAVDERFADALYARRAEAIAASGVRLTTTESQVLASIDVAVLRQMVGNVGGALPEPDRRAFLGRSAAALLAIVSGGAGLAAGAGGCKERELPAPVKGIRPDRASPPDAAMQRDVRRPPISPQPAGIRPDPRPLPPTSAPVPPQQVVPIGGLMVRPRPAAGTLPERPRPTRGIRPDRPGGPTKGIRPDRPFDVVPRTADKKDKT